MRVQLVKKACLCALTFMGVMGLSSQSYALDAPAGLVPAGLNPGDEFFVAFVTLGNIAGCTETSANLDAFGVAQAAAGPNTGLVPGWRTLYAHFDGTNTVAAAEAFGGVTNRPIYRIDGEKIADDRADMFDGDLDIRIDRDQFNTVSFQIIYTGFLATGPASANPLGNGGNCTYGITTVASSLWADEGLDSLLHTHRVYVLSPLLTVPGAVATAPVEAPTLSEWMLILLALMLGGIGYTAAMKTKQR